MKRVLFIFLLCAAVMHADDWHDAGSKYRLTLRYSDTEIEPGDVVD